MAIGLLLAGCATVPTPEPESTPQVPAQAYFVHVYEADARNQTLQTRQVYLDWVRQFYEGSELYPLGWTEFQRQLLAEVDGPLRAETAETLERLGQRIAADWSKHNSLRVVTSPMLLLWSLVIQEAVDTGLIMNALQTIDEDVSALLAGRLPAEEIVPERYAQWLPEPT